MAKRKNQKNQRKEKQKKTPAVMQDQRIEGELLGVLMRRPDLFYKVLEVLRPCHFSSGVFASLYQAMMRLYNEGKPLDYPLIAQVLQRDSPEVKLAEVADDLNAMTVSEDALGYYATYLMELSRRRDFLRGLKEAQAMVEDDAYQCEELFQIVTTRLFKLGDTVDENHFHKLSDVLQINKEEWDERHVGKEPNMGLSTGFPQLNKATLGFRSGELILIAGNTGHGKTAFVLNLIKHILLAEKKGVMIYSLEMAAVKLGARIVRSQFTQKVQHAIGQEMSDADWQIVQRAFDELTQEELPLYIDDTPSMTIEEFYGKAMYAVKNLGVALIVVDYAQLMGGEGFNRQEEVTDVVTGLRRVARKLDVPVIALAQFNRNDPKEQCLRLPRLEGMRESGSLEFTADIVLSVMRPELRVEAASIGGISLKDRAILSVLKNREGDSTHIDMLFKGDLIRFEELPSNMPSLLHAVRRTGGKPDVQAHNSMPKPSSGYTRQGYTGGGAEKKASASVQNAGTQGNSIQEQFKGKPVKPLPEVNGGGYVNNEELEYNYPKG